MTHLNVAIWPASANHKDTWTLAELFVERAKQIAILPVIGGTDGVSLAVGQHRLVVPFIARRPPLLSLNYNWLFAKLHVFIPL